MFLRGGTPDLIGSGRHWTSKCMGHIENFKGILRLFTPYFYWRVCILRYKDIHCTQTMYLAIARSTYYQELIRQDSSYEFLILQYSLFEQTPFRPIYLARPNDYWSIIIWLAREFVEFNRAYLEYMAIFEEASEREHRQKEGHSGITYVYGKYMEYPPPPSPPGENLFWCYSIPGQWSCKNTQKGYIIINWSQNR